MEYQLKENNYLSGQIISNGKNIIQSGRSSKIDIFLVLGDDK